MSRAVKSLAACVFVCGAVAGTLASGCGPVAPEESAGTAEAAAWADPPPAPENPRDSAVFEMTTGLLPCPWAAGWTRSKLFPGAPSTSPLARFCRYEWTGRSAPAIESFEDLGRALGASASWLVDEPNIAPLGGATLGAPVVAPYVPSKLCVLSDRISDQPSVWNRFYQDYKKPTGWLPMDRIPAAGCNGTAPKKVRVAVVDSAVSPATEVGHYNANHGRAVGRIIRDLSCPDESQWDNPRCLGKVMNYPALVRTGFKQVDYENGGHYGRQSDVAIAIIAAVEQWQRDLAGKGDEHHRQEHLVLNLSLGWERPPGVSDRSPNAQSWAERSVRYALEYASCHGALIISAAGNASGQKGGPMFPARWEEVEAPNAQRCADYGVTPPTYEAPRNDQCTRTPSLTSSYRPLVYAIGAVDGKDDILATTREYGVPGLVALGQSVVVPDPFGMCMFDHTRAMSGTSASTAVVSAIAAGVWAYDSLMSPHDVMRIVYESAKPLGFNANVARVESREVRRASFCNAVRAASKQSISCGSYTNEPFTGDATAIERLWYPESLPPALNAWVPPATAGYPGTVALPFAGPQPTEGPCDACGFTLDRNLLISLNPNVLKEDRSYAFQSIQVTLTFGGTWFQKSTVTYTITPDTPLRTFVVPAAQFYRTELHNANTAVSASVTFTELHNTATNLTQPISIARPISIPPVI